MITSLATLPVASLTPPENPGRFWRWNAAAAHQASMYFRNKPKRRKPMPEGRV